MTDDELGEWVATVLAEQEPVEDFFVLGGQLSDLLDMLAQDGPGVTF